MAEPENFFADFTKADYQQWKEAAVKALKGKPFEKLYSKTYEDITLNPIYNQEDIENLPHIKAQMPGFYPFLRNNTVNPKPWLVIQEIPYGNPDDFSAATDFDMPRGLDGLIVNMHKANFQDNSDAFAPGLITGDIGRFKAAFEGIDFENKHFYFHSGSFANVTAGMIKAYCKIENIDINNLKGGILSDPVGSLLRDGVSQVEYNQQLDSIAEMLQIFPDDYKLINIDASIIADSGGNAVDELAYAMTLGAEYMRGMLLRNIEIEKILKSMVFTFSVGANFFMEIAKLRTSRMLWARISKEFGASEENAKMFLYCRTAKINKSKMDPYVNMLRHTTEALAAVVSGCDMLTVGHFDLAHRQPNEFSRRVSRNLQQILRHESHLLATSDPAGGSYYVESLTAELSRKSWEQFTDFEKQGGIMKVIEEGILQKQIKETLAKRRDSLALRKDIILGTNKYINANDKPVTDDVGYEKINTELISNIKTDSSKQTSIKERLGKTSSTIDMLADELMAGACIRDVAEAMKNGSTTVEKIEEFRLAQIFENLRQPIENYKDINGKYPQVYLLNYGRPSNYKARADFSADFFQVGGFETVASQGFNDIDEAAKSVIESNCPVAVFCSSDDMYPEFVPELAKKMKADKPMIKLILAGYPKENIEKFKQAGIDNFIHIKSDILAFHENLQQDLNIKQK